MTLGFLQWQQYPLRTGMRFIYAAFVLVAVFQCLAFLAGTSYVGRGLLRTAQFFTAKRLGK